MAGQLCKVRCVSQCFAGVLITRDVIMFKWNEASTVNYALCESTDSMHEVMYM